MTNPENDFVVRKGRFARGRGMKQLAPPRNLPKTATLTLDGLNPLRGHFPAPRTLADVAGFVEWLATKNWAVMALTLSTGEAWTIDRASLLRCLHARPWLFCSAYSYREIFQ